MENATPNYVYKTQPHSFNHPDGLCIEDYRKICERSYYVLCPTGKFSMECSRLYECLEAGSIPLTITNSDQLDILPSYHHAVFPSALEVGEIPFVIGQNWEECLYFVQNNKTPDKLTEECRDYWKRCKQYWNKRLHMHSEKLFT
jgi:hypothetical protein